jgi:hypothetical protein
MTELAPSRGNLVRPAVVDGVDLDAVATAARSCAAVDDLCPGPWGGVVTYLPGRQVPGVRVDSDHVVISVRGRWGVPASELAGQVRAAVTRLVGGRRVDLVVADLTEATGQVPARLQREEVSSWTTSSPGGVPGASSSAPITPTAAVIPSPSPRVSPNLTSSGPVGRPRG